MENATMSAADFETAIGTLLYGIDHDNPDLQPFNERFFDKLRALLAEAGKAEWSKRPRIYAVLRLIDRVDTMDSFILEGFLDIQFPFLDNQLPKTLSTTSRAKFLNTQRLVPSKAKDAEFGNAHLQLGSDANNCFFIIKQLGGGTFGVVDHVRSKLSLEKYARKRILRARTFSRDKAQMKIFINELANLRRLEHRHLVRLVGSYTDPRYIGILMEPIADCDLKNFLNQTPFPHGSYSLLRRAFGCLCSAIQYLHTNKCRHKDIKPGNILVKGDTFLITDFGTAKDWSDRSKGTTVGPSGPYTPAYAAPEVVDGEPRGDPADIWSLGCVFLDIITVLKGKSLEDRRSFFETNGNGMTFPRNNPEAYQLWTSKLRVNGQDNQPIEWINQMVVEAPRQRVTVAPLLDQILAIEDEQYYGDCCGSYELSDDASLVESQFDDEDTVIPASQKKLTQVTSPSQRPEGTVLLTPTIGATTTLHPIHHIAYRPPSVEDAEDSDEELMRRLAAKEEEEAKDEPKRSNSGGGMQDIFNDIDFTDETPRPEKATETGHCDSGNSHIDSEYPQSTTSYRGEENPSYYDRTCTKTNIEIAEPRAQPKKRQGEIWVSRSPSPQDKLRDRRRPLSNPELSGPLAETKTGAMNTTPPPALLPPKSRTPYSFRSGGEDICRSKPCSALAKRGGCRFSACVSSGRPGPSAVRETRILYESITRVPGNPTQTRRCSLLDEVRPSGFNVIPRRNPYSFEEDNNKSYDAGSEPSGNESDFRQWSKKIEQEFPEWARQMRSKALGEVDERRFGRFIDDSDEYEYTLQSKTSKVKRYRSRQRERLKTQINEPEHDQQIPVSLQPGLGGTSRKYRYPPELGRNQGHTLSSADEPWFLKKWLRYLLDEYPEDKPERVSASPEVGRSTTYTYPAVDEPRLQNERIRPRRSTDEYSEEDEPRPQYPRPRLGRSTTYVY